MYIEIENIPDLLNHVGYAGSQDTDSILKWLREYDDGKYSRFFIRVNPYTDYKPVDSVLYRSENQGLKYLEETGYYWYEAGCIEHYKEDVKNPRLSFEPIRMFSGEPDGMNFGSYDEALKNAIIRCLMLIICRNDFKCKINGQYALLYFEQGIVNDNMTLDELFKKYPYEYENSRSI